MNRLASLALGCYYHGTRPLRSVQNAARARRGMMPAAVLFYHRVADRRPNDWTISNANFRAHIDWLQKHFDLVSLAEAQRRIDSGCNARPTVSLTFDDGYYDNCEFALPLLLERRIPFAYFVSAQQVVEGEPFPHDVEAGQPLAPNTLEQLRELVAAGVSIGAHTRTHADLGAIDDHVRLVDEMITARGELEDRLQTEIDYFAFPFGQPQNLSRDAFQLAKDCGYAGVCSAYGGYNLPGDDAFHLRRIHADPGMVRLQNWLSIDPRKFRKTAVYDYQWRPRLQVQEAVA
jgi:peptidoglycan/xylan/chitin deacetylase (PgdA/CDA1 family)